MSEQTVINKGITVKGEITGTSPIEVHGVIDGTAGTEGLLHVKPGGRVTGAVAGRAVVVEGEVDAQIHGEQKVELRSTAKVRGDISTKALVIAEGATFDGNVKMTGGK